MSTPKNEPKHTPGPWKSTVLRDGARIESDGASVAWVGPDDTRECADGRIVEVMTKRAVANAHLIAAAPDLLAEHHRTLGQLERMQSMTKHLSKTDPLAEEIASAIKGTKAIIAKAEGRS